MMNPILKQIVESGYVKTPNGECIKVHSAISPEEGQSLQTLISQFKPTLTLEIGLSYGISALYICDVLEKKPDTRHIVIDPNQYGGLWGDAWEGIGIHNLREAGYESIIEFLNIPSYQALPQLEKEGRKIDFAFIDGWHTFDYALVDFFYIDKMLRVGGIVVFHDADWESIHKLCRYISTNLSYSLITNLDTKKVKVSMKRRILDKVIRIQRFSKFYERCFNPELVTSNFALGLSGTLVAFRKNSEDTRKWDFHRVF
ncbi:MAG: class I SAM-dependent methyltransferase [Candidatus Omnitrophica bacterium]|nr:class I SAM-dependent methyltransferase [Candidatus Omnitrophota bacterium]